MRYLVTTHWFKDRPPHVAVVAESELLGSVESAITEFYMTVRNDPACDAYIAVSDLPTLEAQLKIITEVKPRPEIERYKDQLRYWLLALFERTNGKVTIVSTLRAPLSTRDVSEVLAEAARHPWYSGQTYQLVSADDEIVRLEKGRVTSCSSPD